MSWTAARWARWVWAASRLIWRNGVLPGGSLKSQGPWLRAEGLAFQMIEYVVGRIKEAGEDLVLIATK